MGKLAEGPADIWLSVNVSNCQLFSLLHILHSSWNGLSNILRMCYFVQALVPFPSVSLNAFPSGPSALLTAPTPNSSSLYWTFDFGFWVCSLQLE